MGMFEILITFFVEFSRIINELQCVIISESILLDIQKRITEAFEIFDHENNKTVDVRYS